MNLKRIAAGLIAGAVICGSTGVYPYAAMNYAAAAETADKAETEEKEEALTAESFLAGGYDTKYATIYSDGTESFNMNGRTYNQGVVFIGQNSYQSTTASISYNTKDINSLSWVWGHIDNTSMSGATVSIYLDDVLTDEYSLSADMFRQDYTVDVSEASTLKISVTTDSRADFAMADVTVDKIKPATSPIVPEYKSVDSFISSSYNTSYTSEFSYVSDLEAVRVNGRYYYQGIKFYNSELGLKEAVTTFNTENVDTFSCSIGHVDNYNDAETTLYVYHDGIPMEKLTLTHQMPIMNYSVDVSETSELKFVMDLSGGSAYAMADISIDELTTSKKGKAPTFKTAEDFIKSGYNRSKAYDFNVVSPLEATKICGRYYYQGIIFGDGNISPSGRLDFNVENINTITATLGHVDNTYCDDSVLYIYKDNVLTDKIDIYWHQSPEEITIDVSDCKNISLYMPNSYHSSYALADISIDEINPKKSYTSPEYKDNKEFMASGFNEKYAEYFDAKSDIEAYSVNGEKCYTGIYFGDSYGIGYAEFNTDTINSLTFEFSKLDGASVYNEYFKIYLDGALYEETKLESDFTSLKRTIDVSDVQTMLVWIDSSIGEFVLHNVEISDEIIEVKLPLGDVNFDGAVNSVDASLVLAEYAAISTNGTLKFDEKANKAADVNKDEVIDSSDASLVLAYYAYTSTGGTETDMEKWIESEK